MTIPSLNTGSGDDKFKKNESALNSSSVTPQKEYSIKEFKHDYQKILYQKVMPILATFEDERKKNYKIALIGTIICIILAIIAFFLPIDRNGDLVGLLIGGAIALWAYIKKKFEKKVKIKIMPTLMQAIPNFYWQESSALTPESIADSMLVPKDNKCSKTFDDSFVGNYRNVEIAISECNYTYGSGKYRKDAFSGVIIRLKMNKNFEGLTVVRPKKNVDMPDCSDLKNAGLMEVKLEDVEFSKQYSIYSTDQIEARYLLTTSFMERFKNIVMAFSSETAFCSFSDNYVYIAPYTKKDLFDLCSLTKSITDSKQFDVLFEEFASILELVDHFKLDKKLGL